MKPIIISNWTNPDLRTARSYVTSYTMRQANSKLFTIDLHKQMGFYQISEFAHNKDDALNFTLEQTNRLGPLKISVFEKHSALMLGSLKGMEVVDESESVLYEVLSAPTKADKAPDNRRSNPSQLKGVTPTGGEAVRFTRIAPHRNKSSVLSKLATWGTHFAAAPKDIMKIEIDDDDLCDMRLHCAIGVVMLSLKTAQQ